MQTDQLFLGYLYQLVQDVDLHDAEKGAKVVGSKLLLAVENEGNQCFYSMTE